MLKLSSKRTYDSVDVATTPVGCSPHKIQFLDSPAKRVRTIAPTSPSFFRESSFPTLPQEDSNVVIARNMPKRHAQNFIGSTPVFTEAEVKSIVEKTLQERENTLRMEYDRILQELLQDQYRNFAKFHEDYVSRQIKDSDFSYMS